MPLDFERILFEQLISRDSMECPECGSSIDFSSVEKYEEGLQIWEKHVSENH